MPLSKHLLALKSKSQNSLKTVSSQQSKKNDKTKTKSFKKGNSSHSSALTLNSKSQLKIEAIKSNDSSEKSLNSSISNPESSKNIQIVIEEPKSASNSNNQESKNSISNIEISQSEIVISDYSSSENQILSSDSSLNSPFNLGDMVQENSSDSKIIDYEIDENSSLDKTNNSSATIKSRFCFCC